jgi:hypothetical protein
MATIRATLSREAHRRLLELASRERRTAHAQVGWMLERLLLNEAEAEYSATSPEHDGRREAVGASK